MTKYYAFIDGEQRGPFDLDRLAEAGVRPSTYVWCKGMDDWHRADEVEEIRAQFRRHINLHKDPAPEAAPVSSIAPPAGMAPHPQNQPEQSQEQPSRFPFPQSVEQAPDINQPPQVSMTLAVLSLILCFLPTGIAAVVFTYKARKLWEESFAPGQGKSQEYLRSQAHEYERMAKMWLGLTVAFGIIAWTLLFSVR